MTSMLVCVTRVCAGILGVPSIRDPGPLFVSLKWHSEPFFYARGRNLVYPQVHHLALLPIKAWLPLASIHMDLGASTVGCHRKALKSLLYFSTAVINIKKRI